MKLRILYSAAILALLSLSISACKDDETPITGISFEVEEQDVSESDGTLTSFHPDITEGLDTQGEGRVITVNLAFDRALAGDVVLKFDVDGDADADATENDVPDYEILDDGVNLTVDDDEITIKKGTESASFNIVVYEDLNFEFTEDSDVNDDGVPYESIEITLESVVSGPGKLGTQLDHTVHILEDDLLVGLFWAANDLTDENNDVDMDMIFWYDEVQWLQGTSEGTDPEIIFLPAGLGTGDVGISYTYYGGSSNDLDFQAAYYSTAGTLEGQRYMDDPLLFDGHYTLVNINAWSSSSLPKIAQTASKDGIDFDNFSSVSQFTQGSRSKLAPVRLSTATIRSVARKSKELKSARLLKR